MSSRFRFMNWPMRAKMATLIVAASLVPLGVVAMVEIREMRQQLVANAANLLAARADQIRERIDTFNDSHQHSVDRVGRLPEAQAILEAGSGAGADAAAAALDSLKAWTASDPGIQCVALLDTSGRVLVATEPKLVGADLSYHGFVKKALRDVPAISDVQVSEEAMGAQPAIAYLAPAHGPDGRMLGLAAIWIRAAVLWDVMKAVNEMAGPGSNAVLFDKVGVRIAHSHTESLLFHPAGAVDQKFLDELVAEHRFGPRTRELLTDPRPFPAEFERARAASPDESLFLAYLPMGEGRWTYGVARRFRTISWTLFYTIPQASVDAEIARTTRRGILFAGGIIVFALAVGTLFATGILKPIRELSRATRAVAGGDLSARVPAGHSDELGRLAVGFNAMTERIQAQAAALQKARDELEERVRERTAELAQTAEKLRAQLARLDLLDRITRAIGERQDLRSIFQVVIRTIEEHLPVDFASICLHDAAANAIVVNGVGVRSEPLAMEMAMAENARIEIDQNGLSRCVHGHLVYEPDIADSAFPFPRRLAKAGLRSLVAAPLLVESRVFGVFIAARRAPRSFSSGECEFLRQVTEHVALASQQAELHGALQKAYDELRETQQAVMQQERLRALGQMASGIAHDINNAISPASLYTESLLESEPNLSARARDYLATIQRAVEDVAQTVSRMREFYRQREPQLELSRVRLNPIVEQVVGLTRARWSDMSLRRGTVIDLRTDLDPGGPAILGVESEIREALTNLVFNAVDAMPDGGTLTLRTRGGPTAVSVEVEDTGIGMDDDTRRRCLEPFFTTKGERGTGLGLAMVYGTVRRHGAEIEIESARGRGTTFRILFPVPDSQPVPEGGGTADPRPSGRMRLLVVDDDPLLIKSLRDALEGDGHEVVAAMGGQAGIDAFRASREGGTPFAAVITDLGMPHVDGRRVSEAIKAMSPGTPVILLTGWGQRLVAEGDVPPHVDRVLNKPPKLRDLRAALAATQVRA